MLRGTLVIWAGILTIILLKRRLHSHHWFGMVSGFTVFFAQCTGGKVFPSCHVLSHCRKTHCC